LGQPLSKRTVTVMYRHHAEASTTPADSRASVRSPGGGIASSRWRLSRTCLPWPQGNINHRAGSRVIVIGIRTRLKGKVIPAYPGVTKNVGAQTTPDNGVVGGECEVTCSICGGRQGCDTDRVSKPHRTPRLDHGAQRLIGSAKTIGRLKYWLV
jgi:hypothetical protein